MTPARLRECLAALGWSAAYLAGQFGLHEKTVRRWLNGDFAIPSAASDWLEPLASFHEGYAVAPRLAQPHRIGSRRVRRR